MRARITTRRNASPAGLLTMRAAVYARFSSDLQNDRSIEDQVALCRGICEQQGFEIVHIFADRAISGSAIVNRPQLQAMLQAAERRGFDVLVATEVDRIARDQGDWHAIRKKLEFLGIAIHCQGGIVSKIDGSLRALMGEMFLENLVAHIRRGMAGVVREGRHTGGRAYGYRPTATPGALAIEPDEADVVRRIFEAYAKGDVPRAIAAALNRDGVKAPRGARWNASTINGNRARGGGILFNPLYRGEIVWNRLRMVKDPATGKRISRPNADSEIMRAPAPHLRIVPDDLFDAAQTRKAGTPRQAPHLARKPKRILSGLLRCGTCGAGMASIGAAGKNARVQCSAHRESGACANGRKVERDAIESLVLDGLKRTLAHPAYLKEYVAAYNQERNRLAAAALSERATLEKRHAHIIRARDRMMHALMYGDDDPTTFRAPLAALDRERTDIETALAALDAPPKAVTLHPGAIARFAETVDNLAASLTDARADNETWVAEFRRLVDHVTVIAAPGQRGFSIDVKGRLATLLGDDRSLFSSRSKEGGLMVAGERCSQSPLPCFSIRLTA